MMNMNDAMTVRQKLLTGFGLVLLLQLMMAVFAMNKMSAVQQNLENILDARYSKIVLVNGVIKTSLENTRLIRDILLASESSERETVIGQMAANRKRNTDTLNTLGASLNLVKGKALFAEIVAAHDQLLSHYDRFNTLVQAGQMADAAGFLRERIVPDNRLLMARLDTMAAFQESLMAGARAEADASYGQARIVMAVLSVLGLTLGAAVALLLSVRIGRSLG
ncbi:MAG: MCP four helix bundle domain-containing protein, partial [Microvirgula sp.]